MAGLKRKAAKSANEAKVKVLHNSHTATQLADPLQKRDAPAFTPRVTRAMSTDAARKAVLNTTELLERILEFVAPTELFVYQRVCRRFKEVIAAPASLRVHMGLRGSTAKSQLWAVVRDPTGPTHRERFKLHRVTEVGSETPVGQRVLTQVKLASVLQDRLSLPDLAYTLVSGGSESQAKFITWQPLLHRSSWQDMLVANPTPRRVRFELRWRLADAGMRGWATRTLELVADLTLSRVLDAVLDGFGPDDDLASDGDCGYYVGFKGPFRHTGVTLRGFLEILEKKHGCLVKIVARNTVFCLQWV